MRGKNTFITRCLRAGICIFVLALLLNVADADENIEKKKPEKPIAVNTDNSVRSEPDGEWDCLSQDNCLKQECDLNADGYPDLLFIDKESGGHRILASYLWSTSQQRFVRGPEVLDGYDYYSVIVDEKSRSIQVGKSSDNSYENYTYQWSNETDCELVKTLCDTRIENGVSVRIISFCDGREQVLMDCEYDTSRFPYCFEKYPYYNNSDIFDEFYRDDPVWEKTIYVENLDETYKLYYAQEIQYDKEDKTKVAGYEGHLWVTGEDTGIVKRLYWQSEAPYTKITWEGQAEKNENVTDAVDMVNVIGESMLFIQYADGSKRTCTLSEILRDPAEAIYEESMQIDFGVKEYAIDTEKYDVMTDKIYKEAYYRAISGQDVVRTSEKGEVYLKEYWFYQGDSLVEMADEIFLQNLIDNTKFYYMDFDGDGLPELVMDIIGDGLHILKYLSDEEIVEIFFGYERMPYYNLLGSGQLYYHNPTLANKSIWEYDIVDEDGHDSLVIYFEEDYDYKPHREDDLWEAAYWVYLDEELGMVQVDEKSYREISGNFFDAVEHAVIAMTFEEIFGSVL